MTEWTVVNSYKIKQDFHTESRTEDLDAIFDEQDKVHQRAIKDINDFTNLADPNKIPAELLPLYLLARGMWLPKDLPGIDLTEAQKRKLARLLIPLYRQKGTEKGIENIARLLLGIEVDVYRIFNINRWRLGVTGYSELGSTTFLGKESSYGGVEVFWFEVRTEVELTQEQEQNLLLLIDYMKPIYMQLIKVVKPETINHWELGKSALGSQTILH